MVGEFHTAPPAGPHSCTPLSFLPVGLGFSGMVYDFHNRLPVLASYATTLPRKVQHPYEGRGAATSSLEDIGT